LRRHIQRAGNAKVSQKRLSSNSILRRTNLVGPETKSWPGNQEPARLKLMMSKSCKGLNASQCNRQGLYARAGRKLCLQAETAKELELLFSEVVDPSGGGEKPFFRFSLRWTLWNQCQSA
jgi:hypothetical protein